VSDRAGPAGESSPARAEDPGQAPSPAAAKAELRESPPPLEANDQLVAAGGAAGWAIALIVLLIVRSDIPVADRWWIWTAVAGLGMGVFALGYVPYLKHARARMAQRRVTRRG
jgi:hypothetical protein